MKIRTIVSFVTTCLLAGAAAATPFTTTSPTGGALPSGVTPVGGIVLDLTGLNGARVVTQAAASSLYVGYASVNPQAIGTQAGFTGTVLGALGGGLSAASARVTLYDGDTSPGNFDANQNTFLVNNVSFGDFTSVATQQTSSDGLSVINTGFGFGDEILSTGFFTLSNVADLATLFSSLSGGIATFALNDVDPYDNFYDFTQGVDGGLINVGTGPIVTPPTNPTNPTPGVPEPASWAMFIGGFGMVGGAMRRRARVGVRFA